jgi:endonuclease/exonuclease/phosphatase family metal-dependent hydrolase
LQEVDPDDIARYADAIRTKHGNFYRFFGSWTGGDDRLAMIFDSDRLKLSFEGELYNIGPIEVNDFRHRSPQLAVFQDRTNDKPILLVNVHLARGNAELRRMQALGLSQWAISSTGPALVIGDCNFDYNFVTETGNDAFEAVEKVGALTWAKPAKLVDTNWYDGDRDGQDDYPDSCLDFAFYSKLPDGATVRSQVIVRDGDFPDDETTSDHRPLSVTFNWGE